MHSFNQHISTEYFPGIRDSAVNQTDKNHFPHGVHILVRGKEESDINQIGSARWEVVRKDLLIR